MLKVQDIFNEITHQRALPNETKEKVDNITEQINYLREADRNLMGIAGNLSAIKEINSTGIYCYNFETNTGLFSPV